MWIKNSDGKKDAVLTMATFGFIVVLAKVLLGGVSLTIGQHVVNFGTIDAAVIGAILGPTLGSYVARRYTDKKYHGKPEKKE